METADKQSTMHSTGYATFRNPEVVAWYEAEGWRAYYDHNLARGLFLMIRLVRSQFGLSWPQSVLAAVDVVRAYRAFQPVQGDLVATRRFLRRFYHRVACAAGLKIDPSLAAQRELEYWIVHRVMAGSPNHEPLIRSLAELHAALFGGTLESMRRSAEHRAAAAVAVDRITGRVSTDIDGDWEIVHQELRAAYQVISTTSR